MQLCKVLDKVALGTFVKLRIAWCFVCLSGLVLKCILLYFPCLFGSNKLASNIFCCLNLFFFFCFFRFSDIRLDDDNGIPTQEFLDSCYAIVPVLGRPVTFSLSPSLSATLFLILMVPFASLVISVFVTLIRKTKTFILFFFPASRACRVRLPLMRWQLSVTDSSSYFSFMFLLLLYVCHWLYLFFVA